MVFSLRITLYFRKTDLFTLYTTRLNLRIRLPGNRAEDTYIHADWLRTGGENLFSLGKLTVCGGEVFQSVFFVRISKAKGVTNLKIVTTDVLFQGLYMVDVDEDCGLIFFERESPSKIVAPETGS